VIDYAVKLMLYRSLEHPAIRYDRSYSTAPRVFSGLGKRKRDLRLAEIAKIYDRYLIGPAVLPETLKGRGEGEHTVHEIRAYWRRGHFLMQPFGLAAAQRKLIFVMPTLVRADRL
jgi:hypothetical protein